MRIYYFWWSLPNCPKFPPSPLLRRQLFLTQRLNSIIGFTGYYRHFINEFFETSDVLHAVTSVKGSLISSEDMNHSFLVRKISSHPQPYWRSRILKSLHLGEWCIKCFTRSVSWQKEDDGKVHPVPYGSRFCVRHGTATVQPTSLQDMLLYWQV